MKKSIEIIKGSNQKKILMDITFPKKSNNKLIIFSHGFKGFKDWGCFNLISKIFAENGFTFLKFNFSHNGTTIADPLNFNDLEAFGNNNFSIELNDLSLVLDWSVQNLNISDITLLGHSRGGAISILKCNEDARINKIVSWASPSDFTNIMNKDKVKAWKDKGFVYVYNSRTNQNMPMNYQFYEDSIKNLDRINIKNSLTNIKIPLLLIHGDEDSSVSIENALIMKKCNEKSILHIIKKANHVFGAKHPYSDDIYPDHLLEAINKTIDFLKI